MARILMSRLNQTWHAGIIAMTLILSIHERILAAPPVLALPIKCQIGAECYIQNFVDHDKGPGWRDYAEGALSTNGHGGTDFSLVNQRVMRAGVDVLAASSGIVAATHDGEADISVRQNQTKDFKRGGAGNFVRIRHADGWETQYSHLKRGSITVHPGWRVETGTILGQVGLSGNSEFPHMHFSVRHHGQVVDPFMPTPHLAGGGKQSLWAPAVDNQLTYCPAGLLYGGFATEIPSRDKAEAGEYFSTTLSRDSPSIAFWIVMFGLRKDDIVEMCLSNTHGEMINERQKVENNNAMLFAFIGKHRSEKIWPPGVYTGRVVLYRDVGAVIEETRSISRD